MGKPVEVDIAPFIKLVACSLCALLSHATMLICACKFIAERDPIGYFKNIRPAVVMAFGTSSSAGALPVTMACGEVNKLRKRTIEFVFPLGATVNMDGSAIYYCVCVMHVSAMAGNALGLVEQLKVAMIGSLVTCGVAPIPGGFIVWIYMVCCFCRKHEGFCVKLDVEIVRFP